jgi:hypothetical protein
MQGIKGYAIYTNCFAEATPLSELLRAVMVRFAQALRVLIVEEAHLASSVRHDVINHRSWCDLTFVLAHAT